MDRRPPSSTLAYPLLPSTSLFRSGRVQPALGAINPLRILAARHFQAIGRTGKFHPLYRARRDILEHDRTAADQIRAARQDLERRDAAVGERAGEAGVLRPDAVLDPYFGGRRARRLIAVVVRARKSGV